MAHKAQVWQPPIDVSAREERILKLCKKHKLYAFFRHYRHELFDDEVQQKLLATYSGGGRGDEPKPPAQLALAMLMQAAFNEPDHEVPALTALDQRWQMVLDCLGSDAPLFSQGTVFNFRMRAIEHGLAQMLVDKTVELARRTKGYSYKKLKVAFDSSPLSGAGRIEDTLNLIGHAALQVVQTAAKRLDVPIEQVAADAGIPLVTASSIKSGLDLDWNDPNARTRGLQRLLRQIDALHRWLRKQLAEELLGPPLKQQWETVERLIEQDTEPDPDGATGARRIRKGTAKDRQISVTDPDMRHGYKSSARRIDGYKRHIAVDLDVPGLICATVVTSANQPDAQAAKTLLSRVEQHGCVDELHVDLGYAPADVLAQRRRQGLRVVTKPYPVRNSRGVFTKLDFLFDWRNKVVTCPNDVSIPLEIGKTVEFPANHCAQCPVRSQCTPRPKQSGRTLTTHQHERFQHQLRRQSKTRKGRAQRRKRTVVEHALGRIGHLQPHAKFRGTNKNCFDLERKAVVNNCYVLDRLWRQAA